ncbi:hypothetical protein D3C78_1030420 [compost metagenome]
MDLFEVLVLAALLLNAYVIHRWAKRIYARLDESFAEARARAADAVARERSAERTLSEINGEARSAATELRAIAYHVRNMAPSDRG